MLVGPRVARRRGLMVGAAVGAAAANRSNANNQPEPTPVAPQEAAPAPVDETAELKKYSDLHDQGVLTDEEFEAKKKQILGI
jgi:hypothetical protein